MCSRHGTDALYFFMLAILVLLLATNLFLDNAVISVLAMVLFAFTVFRAFSKDKKKRQSENLRFLVLTGKIKAPFLLIYNKYKLRDEYEFIRCKNCRGIVAVRRAENLQKTSCLRCGSEVSVPKKRG